MKNIVLDGLQLFPLSLVCSSQQPVYAVTPVCAGCDLGSEIQS